MADNNNRTATSTQIRNMYSEGMCYMNIKFFNANLCFQFYPFISRDNTGRSSYDMKNGLSTTVNFEGAFSLFTIAGAIIDGRIKNIDYNIPCAAGANLNLRCYTAPNGEPEVVFSITKNNVTVSFKFAVVAQNITNGNGQPEVFYIHTALGAFQKTVEGYLTGINADRHLDKLTDDYIKSIQENQQQNNTGTQQPQQQNYNRNNYKSNYNNNGYKKPYNNNNTGYKKPYNNNQGWQQSQQNLNSYEIKN